MFRHCPHPEARDYPTLKPAKDSNPSSSHGIGWRSQWGPSFRPCLYEAVFYRGYLSPPGCFGIITSLTSFKHMLKVQWQNHDKKFLSPLPLPYLALKTGISSSFSGHKKSTFWKGLYSSYSSRDSVSDIFPSTQSKLWKSWCKRS